MERAELGQAVKEGEGGLNSFSANLELTDKGRAGGDRMRVGDAQSKSIRKYGEKGSWKGKSKNKSFNSREWGEFIEEMGSEGERERIDFRKKKGKKAGGSKNWGSIEDHLGKECWNFGRKLGFTSCGQNAEAQGSDGAGEKGCGRLGEDKEKFL